MVPSRHVRLAVLIAGATLAPAGCKKADLAAPVVPMVPDVITIVQGNFQSVQAGLDLPTPVILRVIDNNGAALSDVSVTLMIGEGGGTVTPPSSTTDVRGEVKAKWTLGPRIAGQTLLASTPGIAPVTVHATGYLPTDIVIAQGNGQSAKVSLALPNAIVVRIVATGNVPMVGVPVAFQVAAGGGAISPQSIVTNSLGEATVRWTVGPQPGVNTAIVTASTIAPVTLTANGTP